MIVPTVLLILYMLIQYYFMVKDSQAALRLIPYGLYIGFKMRIHVIILCLYIFVCLDKIILRLAMMSDL